MTVKKLMNFRGDLEVILVKKRGVKNHKLLFMELTDRVDSRVMQVN
jgi:hypothetical protein